MIKKDKRYWVEVALAYTLMLLLICLGASSCVSKKNVEKSHIDTSSVSSVKSQDITKIEGCVINGITWDEETLRRLWTATIFDTSVVDSCGNHPVKAIIKGEDEYKKNSETLLQQEDSTKTIIQVSDTTIIQNNVVDNERVKTEVKPSAMANMSSLILLVAFFFILTIALKVIIKKVL